MAPGTLAGVLAAAVAAAAGAAVIAAHGGPVSVRAGGADGHVGAGLAGPDKLEVVLAAGPAGLLSLQLGHGALARADGGADVGSVRPAVVLLVRAAVDLATDALVAAAGVAVAAAEEAVVGLAADLGAAELRRVPHAPP